MKRETIKKNRIHAAEKKEYYTEREKYWARLEQEADDAEAMIVHTDDAIVPVRLCDLGVISFIGQGAEEQVAESRQRGVPGAVAPDEAEDFVSHADG